MFSYSTSKIVLPVFLVILLVFFQYRLWFSSNGILDMVHLKKQLEVQTQENQQLEKRNQGLLQQVHKLQNNKDVIESRARHELGMTKKDETFYQAVK
jgi:cell division protein FtsB